MSFRSRLLLFFMIIVIVPMIAVALVLFSITAKNIEKESGSVVILTNATVTTKLLNISADEMKYDRETGEAELHGNVRVKTSK